MPTLIVADGGVLDQIASSRFQPLLYIETISTLPRRFDYERNNSIGLRKYPGPFHVILV